LNNASAQISVFPIPDGNSDYDDGEYRVSIPYWKYLPQLSASSDTDWFTDTGDTTIIYMAVADAFFADHDEANAITWSARAKNELKDLIQLDKENTMGEVTSLVYHTGALMPHTGE
jgi:hypothetical protein